MFVRNGMRADILGLLENGGGLDDRSGELGGADDAGLAAERGLRLVPRRADCMDRVGGGVTYGPTHI